MARGLTTARDSRGVILETLSEGGWPGPLSVVLSVPVRLTFWPDQSPASSMASGSAKMARTTDLGPVRRKSALQAAGGAGRGGGRQRRRRGALLGSAAPLLAAA